MGQISKNNILFTIKARGHEKHFSCNCNIFYLLNENSNLAFVNWLSLCLYSLNVRYSTLYILKHFVIETFPTIGSDVQYEPVCGSDGNTYSNRRYVRLAKCNRPGLRILYKGPYRATPRSSRRNCHYGD